MAERCLVFGGSGFIGRHLTRQLVASGYEVSVFVRRHSTFQMDGVKLLYGDFMNAHEIEEAVKEQDYVFHLVSLTNPAESDNDPFIDIETNVKMTIHLLESCVKHEVKRVIFASSGGAIYGDLSSEILHEEMALAPISPYGIGKATIEGYLRYFKNKHNLDYMALRISNAYGEGQDVSKGNHGVIPVFLSRIMKGESVTVLGNGDMTRDFIYVRDLVKFISRVFDREHKYDVYNVGSGVGTSVKEILEKIEHIVGVSVKREYLQKPDSFVERTVLDTSRVKAEFGQPVLTGLEDGIIHMYKVALNE